MFDHNANDRKSTDTNPTRRAVIGTAAAAALPAAGTAAGSPTRDRVHSDIDGTPRDVRPTGPDWTGYEELPAYSVGSGQLHLAGDLLSGRRAGDADVVTGYTDVYTFIDVNVRTTAGKGGLRVSCQPERLQRLATALRAGRPTTDAFEKSTASFHGHFVVEDFEREVRLDLEPAGDDLRVALRTVDGGTTLAVATHLDAPTAARVADHLDTAHAEYTSL